MSMLNTLAIMAMMSAPMPPVPVPDLALFRRSRGRNRTGDDRATYRYDCQTIGALRLASCAANPIPGMPPKLAAKRMRALRRALRRGRASQAERCLVGYAGHA